MLEASVPKKYIRLIFRPQYPLYHFPFRISRSDFHMKYAGFLKVLSLTQKE